MKLKVTIIDAYDSFVHILAGYFRSLGCQVTVVRNDARERFDLINPDQCDALVLGPGPGHPAESGYLELLQINAGRVPTLGVCLGHQAIGLHFGARADYASRLMHGKTSLIHHDQKGVFDGFEHRPLRVMRYHSIILSEDEFPDCMEVSARSDVDNYVMGIRHRTLPIEGIQFHPESVGTERGMQMLNNFVTYRATV